MPQVLLIVQPYLTAYRLPVFASLAKHFDQTILLSSPPSQAMGFGVPSIVGTAITKQVLLREISFMDGRLLWQRGLLRQIIHSRPSCLLIAANPRMLSFWAALLLCRLMRIPCNAYGQGFFNKPTPGFWRSASYHLMVALASRYIGYTASCLEGLRRIGIDRRRQKLVVAENSLELAEVVKPQEKTGLELGILFLGRLRERCELETLITAVETLRNRSGLDLTLHVVGSGTAASMYKTKYGAEPWISWYGEVYGQDKILAISRQCRVGCYPGAAGLSVVHFMGLSLIPLVHDRPDLHMGPEPSYVIDGVNGRLFSQKSPAESLPRVLSELFHGAPNQTLREAAYSSYCMLNTPPLATRLLHVMRGK